jgi:hypothetical protein
VNVNNDPSQEPQRSHQPNRPSTAFVIVDNSILCFVATRFDITDLLVVCGINSDHGMASNPSEPGSATTSYDQPLSLFTDGIV